MRRKSAPPKQLDLSTKLMRSARRRRASYASHGGGISPHVKSRIAEEVCLTNVVSRSTLIGGAVYTPLTGSNYDDGSIRLD